MIRLLTFIGILFVVTLAWSWLVDNPGLVTIEWGILAPSLGGSQFAFSIPVAIFFLLIVALLSILLWTLVLYFFGAPALFMRYVRSRRKDRGYAALSAGMIAVGAGDERLAKRAAKDAGKLITAEPLTLLLEAQAAQLEGEGGRAREAFAKMLENPTTKILGLRGLFIEAEREGALLAAREFAEQALEFSPNVPWAGRALFKIQCAEEDWAGALETLRTNVEAGITEKKAARRLRAVLLVAKAVADEERGAIEIARNAAMEAHRLASDLVPAAVTAARLLTRLGDIRKASRTLETAWKAGPHPELAEAYAYVRTGDSPRDRMERVSTLVKIRPNDPVGQLSLARAAIDAQDWATARESLKGVLLSRPTVSAYELMAELESRETGDSGRAREWLSRAVHAPRDAAWIADGLVLDAWAPTTPESRELDGFEWRVPSEEKDLTAEPVEDERLFDPASGALVPVDPQPAVPVIAGAGESISETASATESATAAKEPPAQAEQTETVEKSEEAGPKKFRLF